MTANPTDALITGQRRFPLDEDILPGSPWKQRVHYQNSGRQIVRNKAGIWICTFVFDRLFDNAAWLGLSIAQDGNASQGKDFHETILFAGPTNHWHAPLFVTGESLLGQTAIILDSEDQLHLLYDTAEGVTHRTIDASGLDVHAKLSDARNWSEAKLLSKPGGSVCEAVCAPDGTPVVYYTYENTLHEYPLGGAAQKVLDDVTHPSLHVDDDGTYHLAFERHRRVFYSCRPRGGTWSEPTMVAYFCSSWPSIATAYDGTVVIAYQGEGKVDLQREPALYAKLRPGGGSTISYAVCRDGKWSNHDLLKSSEIMIKRKPTSSLRAGSVKFEPRMEELWRPSLSIDRNGSVWMLFLNTTRRHVYWSRFGGETFGTHHEARGAYDMLSRNMFVQKDASGSDALGFITAAAGEMYFDALPTATYASSDARRVMFLDNLEVDRTLGLEHCATQWEKHEANPLWGWMVNSDDPDDQVSWVQPKAVEGGYEMHYMACSTELRSNAMPGRLFSADGLNWEKREPLDMSGMTLDGKPFPNDFWRPIYLEDPDEPDPQRRFKGLHAAYQFERNIELRTWAVVTSPDGQAWQTEPSVDPVVLGDISCGFHLMRDDEDANPERRFKAYMLKGAAAGRAVCVFTSADLIHWQRMYWLRTDSNDAHSPLSPFPTGPIAIDPDAAENPWEEEVHDGFAWRDHGLLLMHYDAFYFAGNQHINKALAISRDGRHYWRIARGEINMPHGPCGSWDSGRVRTCIPLRDGDVWRLYYCGMPAGYFGDPDTNDPLNESPGPPAPHPPALQQLQRPWRLGLATLRAEGWAYFQLQRESDQGELTTIPFDYAGGQLVINGSGLAGLRVEWLDSDGAVLTGFGREGCHIETNDSVHAHVTWANQQPTHGRVRLRFVFTDVKAKLYSFGFEA